MAPLLSRFRRAHVVCGILFRFHARVLWSVVVHACERDAKADLRALMRTHLFAGCAFDVGHEKNDVTAEARRAQMGNSVFDEIFTEFQLNHNFYSHMRKLDALHSSREVSRDLWYTSGRESGRIRHTRASTTPICHGTRRIAKKKRMLLFEDLDNLCTFAHGSFRLKLTFVSLFVLQLYALEQNPALLPVAALSSGSDVESFI